MDTQPSSENWVADDEKERVRLIHDLMATRPDVGILRTDDAFLLRFLHARKSNITSSFNLLTRYFEYRQRNKNLFRKFNAAEPGIRMALLDGLPGVLPQRDANGRRILVLFTGNWDHVRYGLVAIYRALLLTLEKLVQEEQTQLNGFIMIIDWSGFTFRQSTYLNPKLLKLIIEGLQDCFPGRFSGIHFISQPWYVEASLTLVKPFLKEKTKQKIFMHGNNLTTLHTHVSKDILPSELGGSGPSYNIEQWAKQLINGVNQSSFLSPYFDAHVIWPQNKTTIDCTPRSQTFPTITGKPTLLDEDFFMND